MKGNFEQQKKKQLERKDKSDKGGWDARILSLLNKLNEKKEYYTTSSCAGRIVLLKASDEKKPGMFLFRSHGKISLGKLKKALQQAAKKEKEVYFKQEAAGLHVAANSLENAQKLIDKAKLAGFKRSGIMATRNRIMCELFSTEVLALPVISRGKILTSGNFLRILARETNKKLERTWEKIKKLEKLFT